MVEFQVFKNDKIVVVKKDIQKKIFIFLTLEFQQIKEIESYCCFYTQSIRFFSKKRLRLMVFSNENVELNNHFKKRFREVLEENFEITVVNIKEKGILELVNSLSETGVIFHELQT